MLSIGAIVFPNLMMSFEEYSCVNSLMTPVDMVGVAGPGLSLTGVSKKIKANHGLKKLSFETLTLLELLVPLRFETGPPNSLEHCYQAQLP